MRRCSNDHQRGPSADDHVIVGGRVASIARRTKVMPALGVDARDLRRGVDDVAGMDRLRPLEGLLAVDEPGEVDADLGIAEELRQGRAEAVHGRERRWHRVGLADLGRGRRSPAAACAADSGAMR